MAWTDLLNSSRQGLYQGIGLNQQRRENAYDRLHSTLQTLGQRKFEEGQAAKGHEYRMSELAQGNEYDKELQVIINDYNLKLEEERNRHAEALNAAADEDARERLEIEHENRLNQIEQERHNALEQSRQEFLQAFQEFPDGMVLELTNPITGEKLTATNATQAGLIYDSIIASTQSDAEAANRPEDEGLVGAVFDTQFAKLRESRPDLWPLGESWWIDVDQETYDELLRAFRNQVQSAVTDGYIKSSDVPAIMQMFDDYVRPPAAEDEPTPEDGTSDEGWGIDVSELRELIAEALAGHDTSTYNFTFPAQQGQQTVTLDAFGLDTMALENPTADTAGADVGVGIERTPDNEIALIGVLEQLSNSLPKRRDRNAAAQYQSRLEEEGLPSPDIWVQVISWLADMGEALRTNE